MQTSEVCKTSEVSRLSLQTAKSPDFARAEAAAITGQARLAEVGEQMLAIGDRR